MGHLSQVGWRASCHHVLIFMMSYAQSCIENIQELQEFKTDFEQLLVVLLQNFKL